MLVESPKTWKTDCQKFFRAETPLEINDHVIYNTFNLDTMEVGLASKYNDGDPADPKFGVLRHSSEIGTDKCQTFNSLPNRKFFLLQDWKMKGSFLAMMTNLNRCPFL